MSNIKLKKLHYVYLIILIGYQAEILDIKYKLEINLFF